MIREKIKRNTIIMVRTLGNKRYIALLWTLPTPKTILTVGLKRTLFHPHSNFKSQRLLFQVPGSEFNEMQKL